MSNIVNLDEYRNSHQQDFDWDKIDPDKMMKLFEDIMGSDDTETEIDSATIDFTRFIISKMYDMGADPEDAKLADDMIYITMLFTSALTEYFTGEHENSDGINNVMYKYLNDIRKGSSNDNRL